MWKSPITAFRLHSSLPLSFYRASARPLQDTSPLLGTKILVCEEHLGKELTLDPVRDFLFVSVVEEPMAQRLIAHVP
jgi:hypothetical protein